MARSPGTVPGHGTLARSLGTVPQHGSRARWGLLLPLSSAHSCFGMQDAGAGKEHRSPSLSPSPFPSLRPQQRSSPTPPPPSPISRRAPAVIAKQAARGGSRDCAVCAALGCIWPGHQPAAHGTVRGQGHGERVPHPARIPSCSNTRVCSLCTRAMSSPSVHTASSHPPRPWSGWAPTSYQAAGTAQGGGTTVTAAAGATSERPIPPPPPRKPPGACGAALEGNALTPMCCTLGFRLAAIFI